MRFDHECREPNPPAAFPGVFNPICVGLGITWRQLQQHRVSGGHCCGFLKNKIISNPLRTARGDFLHLQFHQLSELPSPWMPQVPALLSPAEALSTAILLSCFAPRLVLEFFWLAGSFSLPRFPCQRTASLIPNSCRLFPANY